MAGQPTASDAFFKGHGLGNDYLVFEAGASWALSAPAVTAVCDRWRGVGGDGIVLSLQDDAADFRLRMFNPDGSEFERSGNGLRVFAAYAASRGWVDTTAFTVEVGGDQVEMRVEGRRSGGEYDVSVDMGLVSLRPVDAGLAEERLQEGRIEHPDEGPLDFVPVSVGNPHCVVFTEDLSQTALTRLGPFLSSHPAFPDGVNVQLARRLSDHSIEIAIWERGVGKTSASGTSSCAAAAAAVDRGLVDSGEVEVLMEGGALRVTVEHDGRVVLRGPVREVASGRLAPGFLDALAEEHDADR